MHEGKDELVETDADAAFEAEVQRIEVEIRALFATYAEQAGAVPARLIRLAQQLERLRLEQAAALGPEAAVEPAAEPGDPAPVTREAGTSRFQA